MAGAEAHLELVALVVGREQLAREQLEEVAAAALVLASPERRQRGRLELGTAARLQAERRAVRVLHRHRARALGARAHETHAIVQGLRASADDLHEQMRHVQAKLALVYVPFKAAAWEVGQSLNGPPINLATNAPPFDD